MKLVFGFALGIFLLGLVGASGHYIADEKIIGYHGYEQYYRDIYYRFYLQRIRQNKFGQEFDWLNDRQLCFTQDHVVAYLGWQRGKYEAWRWKLGGFLPRRERAVADNSRRGELANELVKHKISEKKSLQIPLKVFFNEVMQENETAYVT